MGNRAISVNPADQPFPNTGTSKSAWAAALLPIAPALILALSVLLPPEFRITIAGQTLYSYRLAGFALLPWLMLRMLRGSYQFAWPDVFVFLSCAWMTISLTGFYGFARGFPSGVAFALDGLLAYLIARVSFRNVMDFRRFLIVLAPVFFLFALLLAAEAIFHIPFIRSFARAVFSPLSAAELGSTSDMDLFSDTRFGLLRATGPFAHPILAGVFFSNLLALYWGASLRSWPFFSGVGAGLLAVFSLSSAALLSLGLNAALFAYDRLQRSAELLNWKLVMIASAGLLALVQVVAQNGIIAILIRFTLNPQTGYYRLLIWEYASQSVAKYPLIGIGFTPYERLTWMDESIDAFWLSLAVRHGLLTPICLLIAAVLILIMLMGATSRANDSERQVYFGLSVTIFTLVLVGFTVSFFGAIASWFFLLLGIATSLALAARRQS